MSTPSQHQRSNSSATSTTLPVVTDDQDTTEHTHTAPSEFTLLQEAQVTPHAERDGESNGLSQASYSTNTAGREPPSLYITSSISPNPSASGGTPMNNLVESTTRAARTVSYVTESHAWYSRLRPVEPNDEKGTTHGPQEVATRLTTISASLEGLSPRRDDTKTGSSVTYPAQITQSIGMLVGETPEDDGICLYVPIPPFVMF